VNATERAILTKVYKDTVPMTTDPAGWRERLINLADNYSRVVGDDHIVGGFKEGPVLLLGDLRMLAESLRSTTAPDPDHRGAGWREGLAAWLAVWDSLGCDPADEDATALSCSFQSAPLYVSHLRAALLAASSPQEGGGGREVDYDRGYEDGYCAGCANMSHPVKTPLHRLPLTITATASGHQTEGVLVGILAAELDALEAEVARLRPPPPGVQGDREALELVLRHHLPVKTPDGSVICLCDVTATFDGPVGHRLHVADALLAALAPLLGTPGGGGEKR
jgi:hypothetical protein